MASGTAQQIKPQLVVLAFHTTVPIQGLAAPLAIHAPVTVPGRAEYAISALAPAARVDDQDGFLGSSLWTAPNMSVMLFGEHIRRWKISLYLSLSITILSK